MNDETKESLRQGLISMCLAIAELDRDDDVDGPESLILMEVRVKLHKLSKKIENLLAAHQALPPDWMPP